MSVSSPSTAFCEVTPGELTSVQGGFLFLLAAAAIVIAAGQTNAFGPTQELQRVR